MVLKKLICNWKQLDLSHTADMIDAQNCQHDLTVGASKSQSFQVKLFKSGITLFFTDLSKVNNIIQLCGYYSENFKKIF